jgi:ADP-ribose pyrophosphatase YjhB (NUDIX family)
MTCGNDTHRSGRLYPSLLHLWRIVPWPSRLRQLVLWWTNSQYLVVVAALIWDEDGRLLLGRHTYLPPPGWSLPGGYLQDTESPEAALRRELAEELGFAVEIGPAVGWVTLPEPRRILFGFTCHRGAGAFQPNPEIAEIAYFPVAEALRLMRRDVRVLVEQAVRLRAY